jgi:hypothetical protein
METEIRDDNEVDLNSYEYIHFENTYDRDTYLSNNKHFRVSHLCCGGKGIALEKKNPPIRLVRIIPNSIHPIGIKGTCDICFMDNVELHKTCQTCSQPFCRSCLDKIVTKVCPYCRGKLRNNV